MCIFVSILPLETYILFHVIFQLGNHYFYEDYYTLLVIILFVGTEEKYDLLQKGSVLYANMLYSCFYIFFEGI